MTDRIVGPLPPMFSAAKTQLLHMYLKLIQLCYLGQLTLTPLNLGFPIHEMGAIIPTADLYSGINDTVLLKYLLQHLGYKK